MKKIKLTKNQYALVDNRDFEWLNKIKWTYHSQNYAYNQSRREHCILMHRLIMNAKKGQEVDHVNRDGLDNRRSNLRLCSSSFNKLNKPAQSNSKSGIKGVCWDNAKKKWKVQLQWQGEKVLDKYFKDKNEASRAYEQAIAGLLTLEGNGL